jgi:tetratricopeptide (TPR) repeat protein
VDKVSAAPDLSDFLRSHVYYQNICSQTLVMPGAYNGMLESPDGKQLLQFAFNEEPAAVRQRLERTRFGLPAQAEEALKTMLNAFPYMKYGAKSYYSRSIHPFQQYAAVLRELQTRTLRLAPDVAEYWYNFGAVQLKLDNVNEAVELLEKSTDLSPELGAARASLAMIYTICRAWEQGLRHARVAVAAGAEMQGCVVDMCLSACSLNLKLPPEGSTRFEALREGYPYTPQDALAYFPQVASSSLDHSSHDRMVVFTSCDSGYFLKHGLALACSVDAHSPGYAMHIHIMNPSAESLLALGKLKAAMKHTKLLHSSETFDVRRYCRFPHFYYVDVRDCRLYQLVRANPHRFLKLDTDMLVMKPLSAIAPIMDHDVLLASHQEWCVPYWELALGGFQCYRRSPGSLRVLTDLCMLCFDNVLTRRHRWFSNELYMAHLCDKYRGDVDIAFADAKSCCDLEHGPDSVIWAITTEKLSSAGYLKKKHELLRTYGLENYIAEDERNAAGK